MADTPFIPGWKGYAQIKSGATALDIPALSGSSYGINDNVRIEMLAQAAGVGNAYPVNYNPGIKTASLMLMTRAFAGWFTPANINAMFATRGSTYGDLTPLSTKFNDGSGIFLDDGKGAGISISASARAMGPVDVSMSFLTQALGTATGTFATYVASTGTPYFYKGISIYESDGTTNIYGIEDMTFSFSPGLSYGKWFDGTNTVSNIDEGLIGGTCVLTQRAGANTLMDASTTKTIRVKMLDAAGANPVWFTFQLLRLGQGRRIQVGGNVLIATSWLMYSVDGSTSPFVCAAS